MSTEQKIHERAITFAVLPAVANGWIEGMAHTIHTYMATFSSHQVLQQATCREVQTATTVG